MPINLNNCNNTHITCSYLQQFVSEEEIVLKYIGVEKIPCTINSPIREDPNPSLRVLRTNSGGVILYDFGSGISFSIYDLLSKIWDLNFNDVVDRIYNEMVIEKKVNTSIIRYNNKKNKSTKNDNAIYNVKIRKFRDYDLDYWGKYGITQSHLEWANIFPISHIFVSKQDRKSVIPAERYAYVYLEFKDKVPSFKIYQPFSDKFKWMSQHDQSVWDLWDKMPPKMNLLFITKSRKDAVCIKANLGYNAISMQGEGYIPKNVVVSELLNRAKKIVILYDNDDTGIKRGKFIHELFNGSLNFVIDKSYGVKDISDFREKYGKDATINLINNFLENE